MTETAAKSAEDIRRLRALYPEMRERDFARIHAISEADLVAAEVGRSAVRLKPDLTLLLNGLTAVGEVMALTRNESAVHEKIGPYEKVVIGPMASMVPGAQVDLRIFPSPPRSLPLLPSPLHPPPQNLRCPKGLLGLFRCWGIERRSTVLRGARMDPCCLPLPSTELLRFGI